MLVVPEEIQTDIILKILERVRIAVSKTEELERQEFSIAGVRKKVESIIAKCVECISYASSKENLKVF